MDIITDQPMTIEKGYPPNISFIQSVFPTTEETVFAYGNVIYSPQGEDLRPDLIYHEHVHRKQQALHGGPELWWNQYLSEPEFRLAQEVEAYYEQWQFVRRYVNAKIGKQALQDFAYQLASPLYQLGITANQAETLIRKYGSSH